MLIDPLGLAYQLALAGSAAIMVLGFGVSGAGMIVINFDGMKSSVYVQAQLNGGVGGGAFDGWGDGIAIGKGAPPISGAAVSTNYGRVMQVTILLFPQMVLLMIMGNVNFSATVSLKAGQGYGAGAFYGVSGT